MNLKKDFVKMIAVFAVLLTVVFGNASIASASENVFTVKPGESVECTRAIEAQWDLAGGGVNGGDGAFDLVIAYGEHIAGDVTDGSHYPDYEYHGDWETDLQFTNTGNSDWEFICKEASTSLKGRLKAREF